MTWPDTIYARENSKPDREKFALAYPLLEYSSRFLFSHFHITNEGWEDIVKFLQSDRSLTWLEALGAQSIVVTIYQTKTYQPMRVLEPFCFRKEERRPSERVPLFRTQCEFSDMFRIVVVLVADPGPCYPDETIFVLVMEYMSKSPFVSGT